MHPGQIETFNPREVECALVLVLWICPRRSGDDLGQLRSGLPVPLLVSFVLASSPGEEATADAGAVIEHADDISVLVDGGIEGDGRPREIKGLQPAFIITNEAVARASARIYRIGGEGEHANDLGVLVHSDRTRNRPRVLRAGNVEACVSSGLIGEPVKTSRGVGPEAGDVTSFAIDGHPLYADSPRVVDYRPDASDAREPVSPPIGTAESSDDVAAIGNPGHNREPIRVRGVDGGQESIAIDVTVSDDAGIVAAPELTLVVDGIHIGIAGAEINQREPPAVVKKPVPHGTPGFQIQSTDQRQASLTFCTNHLE